MAAAAALKIEYYAVARTKTAFNLGFYVPPIQVYGFLSFNGGDAHPYDLRGGVFFILHRLNAMYVDFKF